MNPVVKVVCGDKAKRSLQAKGTNNPFFDQVRNYYFCIPLAHSSFSLFDCLIFKCFSLPSSLVIVVVFLQFSRLP